MNQTEDDAQIAKSKKRTTIAAVVVGLFAIVASVGLGLLEALVLPSFSEIFSSFGPDLPAVTHWLMTNSYVLWWPLVFSIIFWVVFFVQLIFKFSTKSSLMAFSALLIICVMSLIGTICAMYLPIFKLGQAV